MYRMPMNHTLLCPTSCYPYINHTPNAIDPDEQLKTFMLIWKVANIDSLLKLIPIEVLFHIVAPLLRESYLKSLGVPLRERLVNDHIVQTREYTITDYIQDYGQPYIKKGELKLSNKGLTSLYGLDRILYPETVTAINLSKNILSNYVAIALSTSLPDHVPPHPFSGFVKLTSLELQDNKFHTLPEDFFQGLSSLNWLDLSKNQLHSLPSAIFRETPALSNLRLQNNQLEFLPEDVFQGLTSLRLLALPENNLRALPKNIFKDLRSLKVLYIENNYLSGTEEEFKRTHPLPKLPPYGFGFNPQKEDPSNNNYLHTTL